MNASAHYVVEPSAIDTLLSALVRHGYRPVGPTVRDNAIVYDEITSVQKMPVGWGDDQTPGAYRLRKRKDNTIFGFNLGPHSWKKFLLPPALKLLTAERNKDGSVVVELGRDGNTSTPSEAAQYEPASFAFIGVRPCELHAIGMQDKVLMGGAYRDAHYASVRERIFIVAVNCTQAAATCFCTSMNTGPKADRGFDLCLTEVVNDTAHYFLVAVGSDRGEEVMQELPFRGASTHETEQADLAIDHAATSIKRTMDTTNIRTLLQQNLEHPQWNIVADRCLSCANCTLVCPTCFCHNIEDTTDLTGSHAERWRKWDSCFTLDFSYIHGGSIRTSRKSRYRQWLTHKLSNWFDQFGTSGCVGCGRCITWCPVGIDITEEVCALRSTPATSPIMNKVEVNNHGVA